MKKKKMAAGILFFLLFLSGCSVIEKEKMARNEIPFEFVEEECIPEDLEEKILEKKMNPFRMVYSDMEYLYIAEGYGAKEYEKNCIEVKQCKESKDAIYIEMILHGPGGEGWECETKFPYCVIRMECQNKPVIFED